MKKYLKRALCAMFVLIFMLVNANIALAGDVIVFSSEFIEPELHNTASNGSYDNLEMYVDIDEFQKYILDCIMTDDGNLANGNQIGYIDISQFNIPYNDNTSIEISKLIWYESPELFRIDSIGYSYTMSGKMLSITPYYRISSAEEFKQQYDVFVDVSEKMLIGIKDNPTLSDVEKALLLHDRLAEYCEYDNASLLAGAVPDSSYSAQGVFCMGVAVCMGYALAYDYLLEQVGIEAEYCSSSALNHAWNIVYIDNKPYYVDVTWDDPVWDVSGRVYHDDFMVSYDVFKESHKATDYKVISGDTTYDNAFWQNSTTAFQLVDNKIYYIDNENAKLSVIDDISDTTPEALVDLNYTWTTADGGGYWPGNYSRLASIRDKIFYSAPTAVYSYTPATNTTEEILTSDDIVDITGKNGYRIYGMTAVGCTLWGEFSETPNYTSTTKREQIFVKDYHNPTENWQVVIAPTYTSEGKEKNYCIDCGEELGSRLIPALEDQHIWSEWYIDEHNPPSCTDKGVELRDCSHCDAYEWRYGTALGHSYSETYKVDLEATCIEKGVKSRWCTRCSSRTDITEIPATNIHIEGDAWIKGKEATCKEDGYLYKACKGCAKEMSRQILPKANCVNFSVTGYKEATCLTNGYTGDKTCRDCGALYKGETIKAKGHTEVFVTGKAATCTATGLTEGAKCSVCGTVTKAQQTIAKTAHKISIVGVKKATTTEAGYTGDKICSVCNTVTEKGMVIPKLLTLATPTVKIAKTAKGITVTWNAVENAEKYIVYRRTYNASTKKYSGWTALKSGYTGTSYADTTVKIGTTYSYTVKAVNGSVQSKYTATSGLKYDIIPTVTIANASNGVKVTWTTVANATGYRVYSSTYNASTKKWSGWTNRGTAAANRTTWTDTKAKSGTYYKYTVRAMNGSVGSSYKASAQTLFLAQPTVKIANNASGMKVSWNKIAGSKGYTVYRSEYVNGAWSGWKNMGTIKNGSTVSWVDKSVKSGTQYRYTVRTVNGNYKSTYKASNTLLYLAQPKTTVKAVSNGINVAWTQSAGATGFTVYRMEYNAKTKKWSGWKKMGTAAASKKNWTDKSAKKGVTYRYTVKAVNGSVASTYVASSSVKR